MRTNSCVLTRPWDINQVSSPNRWTFYGFSQKEIKNTKTKQKFQQIYHSCICIEYIQPFWSLFFKQHTIRNDLNYERMHIHTDMPFIKELENPQISLPSGGSDTNSTQILSDHYITYQEYFILTQILKITVKILMGLLF